MNEYGLDVNYFSEKLALIIIGASRYTPAEMARALARLSFAADEEVMKEKEFVKAQVVPEGYTLISTELLNKFPEINLSNYGPDDVDALNAWGIEVVTASAPEEHK